MAARTLEQIMAELDPGYTASRTTIQNQQAGLGGQEAADLAQLEDTKVDAYRNIDDTAAARGVLYGGVPAISQSQYLKNTFTPAYSGIKSNYANKSTSLEEALNSLNREQRSGAMGIYQQEQDRAQQQAQWEAQMAEQRRQAAASAINLGGLGGPAPAPGSPAGAAQIQRTAKGGFNFVDASGRPITAAQYSKLTGVGFRSLLSQMAANGDANAKLALQYVGDDGRFGSAPQQYAGALSALGASGNFVNTSYQDKQNQGAGISQFFQPTDPQRVAVAKSLGVPLDSPLVDRYIASGRK